MINLEVEEFDDGAFNVNQDGYGNDRNNNGRNGN